MVWNTSTNNVITSSSRLACSAVTHASLENWQYMDIIREAADPTCADHLVNAINTIDSILTNGPAFFKRQLKNVFGLGGLEHDEDFVSVLEVRYIYRSFDDCY